MIDVTFFKDSSDQFVGFEFLGHAEADEIGKDIVCAAISVLVVNAVNSIEAFTEDDFICDADEESGGMVKLLMNGELSNESNLLLNSLYLGVQGVRDEDDNEKYITLEIKEV